MKLSLIDIEDEVEAAVIEQDSKHSDSLKGSSLFGILVKLFLTFAVAYLLLKFALWATRDYFNSSLPHFWGDTAIMTAGFVLVLTITLGFSSDQQTFQISFPKESHAECLSDAEKLQKKLPFVSVTATCEPSFVYPQNKNEESVNTWSAVPYGGHETMWANIFRTKCGEVTLNGKSYVWTIWIKFH